MQNLPADFDVSLIGDDSKLPADALNALRELAWRKASTDHIWFLENFWHVIDPKTFQWTKFKLRDYQREDMAWFAAACTTNRERKLVLKARQIGWTTGAAAIAFHDAWFIKNHPWLIASQTEDDAKDTLATKVKQPYDVLPLWMRERGPKITDQNSERVSFDNGSNILSIASTSRSGRSKAVFGVLLDEFAFVEQATGLLSALDPLCYGPLVVFSTAFGMGNRFHELWLESQRHDSEWDARFRPWSVVPERDEKWYEREKRKSRGKEAEFYQEYPSNPEEAFAKTGRAVLPMDLLRDEQHWCEPNWKVDLNAVRLDLDRLMTTEWLEGLEQDADADPEHALWVWEPPIIERDERGRLLRQPNYVVSVDVAEGLEHGDRTSIHVTDANTWEQVCTYLGYWPVEDLGELIEWIGYSYHIALAIVERNNHGILPLDYLRRVQYPRKYRMAQIATRSSGDRTPRYGWHTNKATKPKMVNDYIRALRDRSMVLHDSRFLVEASVFVSDGKGGYGAVEGHHDDHIIGAMMGLQGCMDVGDYPVIWYDDSIRPLTFGQLKEVEYMNAQPSGVSDFIGGRKRAKGDSKVSFIL